MPKWSHLSLCLSDGENGVKLHFSFEMPGENVQAYNRHIWSSERFQEVERIWGFQGCETTGLVGTGHLRRGSV